MKTQAFIREGVGVIQLIGTLNAHAAPELENAFQSLFKQKVTRFVFDMQGVVMMDSTGLGTLIRCLRLALEKGGNIKLSQLQDKPRMVLEITRTYQLFEIYDRQQVALDSYGLMEVSA